MFENKTKKEVLKILKGKNPDLDYLLVFDEKMSDKETLKVLKAIGSNKTITTFHFSCTTPSDKVIDALALALRKNDTINVFYFTYGKLTTASTNVIFPELKITESLKDLNVTQRGI